MSAPGIPLPHFMRGTTVAIVSVGGDQGASAALARILSVDGASVIEAIDAIKQATVVVLLAGLQSIGAQSDAIETAVAAVQVARRFATGGTAGRSFVVVQAMGGRFGEGGVSGVAWHGCFAGLARTAMMEWPDATVRLLDIASAPAEAMASDIHRELATGGTTFEVGLPGNGTRLIPLDEETTLIRGGSVALPENAVLLITGGARGVTAACAIALAQRTKCRLALLRRGEPVEDAAEFKSCTTERELVSVLARRAHAQGETAAPALLIARARAILAMRESAATVAAIEAAGSQAMLISVDVTNAADVARAVAEIHRAWGRIDGIVHGAGILADRLIADKTDEQARAVISAKIAGLRNLLDATAADELRAIVVFSSVAGRYGNVGQSDYAMANAGLGTMAQVEAKRRGVACLVRAIDWGAWDGGMVSDSLRANFARQGVVLIDLELGAQAFVSEIHSGNCDPGQIHVALVPHQQPGASTLARRRAEAVLPASKKVG